jgi:hypothetical protein
MFNFFSIMKIRDCSPIAEYNLNSTTNNKNFTYFIFHMVFPHDSCFKANVMVTAKLGISL